jgi:hypothetical protein
MDELLSKLDGGELIALVAVGGGLLCGIVGIIMGCWLEMRRVSTNAALKQDMLDRGMCAEDIRTVLNAGSGQTQPEPHKRSSCSA